MSQSKSESLKLFLLRDQGMVRESISKIKDESGEVPSVLVSYSRGSRRSKN